MNILVTGGAGYIGSHTLVKLIEQQYNPIVYDNFYNSSPESLLKVEKITGHKVKYFKGDIRDDEALNRIFSLYPFNAVVHFAGLKSASQSVLRPIEYYENNVLGSLNLFKTMMNHNVKAIVFSSSAAIYGNVTELPIKEDIQNLNPLNPYGKSKLIIENLLNDIYQIDNEWKIINLRYFNPIGAHHTGIIGECSKHIQENLLPIIAKIVKDKNLTLNVFGADYDTHDGTGIRDFIHIDDLAFGHIKALEKIIANQGIWNVNLGTGKGYSVLEIINTFEEVTGELVPYIKAPRRYGDISASFADPSYAKKLLGWEAKKTLHEMIEDFWRWESNNK